MSTNTTTLTSLIDDKLTFTEKAVRSQLESIGDQTGAAISHGHLASDALATAVATLARLEGALEVYHQARQMAEAEVEDLRSALTRTFLLAGAGDTWSGRGNDERRSRFDGIREAVGWIFDTIERVERGS